MIGRPGSATWMRSLGSPWPWPIWAAEVPPTKTAPVLSATTAESMAWSKWVCTGSTASSRVTLARVRSRVDPRKVWGDPLDRDGGQRRAAEEAVRHQGRLAVIEQQGADAKEHDGQLALVGSGYIESVRVLPQVGAPELHSHGAGQHCIPACRLRRQPFERGAKA